MSNATVPIVWKLNTPTGSHRAKTRVIMQVITGNISSDMVPTDMAAVVARACEGLATGSTKLTYSLVYSLPYFG